MPNTKYDIPAKAKRLSKRGSPALQEFYHHFFINETGLIRGEVDLTFLKDLSPQESAIAKGLIRRNLDRGYTHIIEGAAAFHDQEAVPQLKKLLARAPDLSRRLTIAGALWKLDKDPSFPACLREMVESDSNSLKVAHMNQLSWLGDERAINILIELLSDGDSFVRYLALTRLNEIEHKKRFVASAPPSSEDAYVSRHRDDGFMAMMVKNLTDWLNANAA